MIEAALVAHLLGTAAVTSLVERRIKPQPAPQGSTYPHVTYITVSDVQMSRGNLGRTALREARVQFDAWGKTLESANQVAKELTRALDPVRGADEPHGIPLTVHPTAVVHNGREAQRITFDESELQVAGDPAARPRRVQIDFRFQYTLQETP